MCLQPTLRTPLSKAGLRREAEDLRASQHVALGLAAAQAIAAAPLPFLNEVGLNEPGLNEAGAKVISGYRAIGSELDPAGLMQRLRDEGHKTALPVVVGRGKPLIFRSWAPGDPLKAGWKDIGEPLDSAAAVEPDILLVPLLLVDRAGYRLGYGAGYYDISLAELRRRRRVEVVGIAFAAQIVDGLPREAHDEPVDWILTECDVLAVSGDAPGIRS